MKWPPKYPGFVITVIGRVKEVGNQQFELKYVKGTWTGAWRETLKMCAQEECFERRRLSKVGGSGCSPRKV